MCAMTLDVSGQDMSLLVSFCLQGLNFKKFFLGMTHDVSAKCYASHYTSFVMGIKKTLPPHTSCVVEEHYACLDICCID